MLIEQQITERRERAAGAIAKILKRPRGEPYGDYSVKSGSGRTYRLAMRGPGLFENYCSCPDFRVNTLGTCKHIEAMLLRLRSRHGAALERKGYARTRSSISLQYGETIEIRLRMPALQIGSTLKRCFCGCGAGTAPRWSERAMRAPALPSRCNMERPLRSGCECRLCRSEAH